MIKLMRAGATVEIRINVNRAIEITTIEPGGKPETVGLSGRPDPQLRRAELVAALIEDGWSLDS